MKKITVEYKGIGDKEAQTITRESYSFRPAYDDYDSTFECEYQQSLGKLVRALYAEYDIIHEIEKQQAERAIPSELSDDPEDAYTGLLEMSEYEKQREAWVDAKLSDSAFVMGRFNEMFAPPSKYGEYIKIIAIEN